MWSGYNYSACFVYFTSKCDTFLLSHFFILEHKATYVEIKVKFIEKV